MITSLATMRAASRPTAQWRLISLSFSVVPDFVVKTVVTRDPRTSIPFGRLLTYTVRAVPHGFYPRGANIMRVPKTEDHITDDGPIAAQRRRCERRSQRDLHRRTS